MAEDDANDALLFQRAFKSAGVSATVHFVSDGVEVIDYLRGKQLFEKVASSTLPGLLLLNTDMPRLSRNHAVAIGVTVGKCLWAYEKAHQANRRIGSPNSDRVH